jgi:predicted HTH transcriptional regulator
MTEFKWEDALTERKTENDLKDLRKTIVAFANTVRPGHTARILIGECDDGTVQGVKNADQIQKKVRSECEGVYPPIIWRERVYEKGEKTCVEVEIEYSGETPHFGSPAWVRIGSE